MGTMGEECPQCKRENTSEFEFCKNCVTSLTSSKGDFVSKILETPIKKLTKKTIFADRFEIREEWGKHSIVN